MLMMLYLHITTRTVAFAYNKVPTEAIIPCAIKVPASVVIELNISEVILPVLDRVEVVVVLANWVKGLAGNCLDLHALAYGRRCCGYALLHFERRYMTPNFEELATRAAENELLQHGPTMSLLAARRFTGENRT